MANFDDEKEGRVVRRYCDTSMAKKKGYLPCRKQCRICHACVEVLSSGDKRHVCPKGVPKTIQPDDEPHRVKTEKDITQRCRGAIGIAVIGTNVKTGETVEYKTMSDAAKDGFTTKGISRCCNGETKTHKGYKWRKK